MFPQNFRDRLQLILHFLQHCILILCYLEYENQKQTAAYEILEELRIRFISRDRDWITECTNPQGEIPWFIHCKV